MTVERTPGGGVDERLRSLYAATSELMTASTREALCDVVVGASVRALGYPLTGVHLRAPDGEGLEPAAYPEPVRRRFDDGPPTYGPGGRVYEVYESGEPLRLGASGDGAAGDGEGGTGGGGGDGHGGHDGGAGVPCRGVVAPIPGHGVLIAGTERGDGDDGGDGVFTVDDADGIRGTGGPPAASAELVELLAEHAGLALDRLERETRLNGLHESTRELMEARDTASVAAAATNTAHEVLGMRLNAVYLRSTDGTRLVPVSVTGEARDLFGEVPELDPDSVAWEVYESGEPARHGDVRRAERVANPATPIRSELAMPLGDHGVFLAGSTRPDRFDETDAAVARVFADNVEAALDRAEREAVSRRREGELARQNQRLDEFASFVSHDLRNPLNVAQGRLELLADDCDSAHVDHIADAHSRMEGLIDDLLALARHGRSIGDVERVAVAPLVRSVWTTVEGGELVVADGVGAVEADESRLRELFANLLRNAVEHVGPDVTVEVSPLADGRGFAVADDGPGVPADEREEVFERGYTTAADGTGFGLAIVTEIVRAHGWSVELVEADGGGARFEVRTDGE